MNLLKSQAIICVNVELKPNISEISVYSIRVSVVKGHMGKMHLVKFSNPKALEYTLSVTYNNLGLRAGDNVKFLVMYLDCHLN
jgi:hypothetical protein